MPGGWYVPNDTKGAGGDKIRWWINYAQPWLVKNFGDELINACRISRFMEEATLKTQLSYKWWFQVALQQEDMWSASVRQLPPAACRSGKPHNLPVARY